MQTNERNEKTNPLILVCSENNDFYRAIRGSGIQAERYDELEEALDGASAGSGMLVLADRYPAAALRIGEQHLAACEAKRLKLYVEYPESMSGLSIAAPKSAEWERVVATSDLFSPEIEAMSIMALHGCWHVPVELPEGSNVHLSLARVAGYDKAVFGLPDVSAPILAELPNRRVLVAASALSNCIRGRYAPLEVWRNVWKRILTWIGCPDAAGFTWQPTVSTRWEKDDDLPGNVEDQALELSMNWFRRQAVYSIDSQKGAIEGFESNIRHDGKQLMRAWLRADCIAETAMAFAYDYASSGNPESKKLAEQMLDSVWLDRSFYNDAPGNPLHGLVNWYDRRQVFYGDDNARVILASLAARQILASDRWDERIMACLVGNYRTASKTGFRRPALANPKSFEDGQDWTFYHEESFVHLAPHYQCYLWACNLWAYRLTGYKPLLEQAKRAIRTTMEATPSQWKWTNGLSQEIARMVLPLSFLVQVENTEEHRRWLFSMTDVLLSRMEPCGAIRDMLGPLENGKYPPPRSNDEYGLTEASLMQEEGDPVCDLVYTANWALIGLHEAYAATGDERLKDAEDRLMSFLCRIQVRSEAHPYIDGAWMRSFDDVKWEYWGSSADNGWGAWCVESGWTNSWIATVLSMRKLGSRLFDERNSETFRNVMPIVLRVMELPEETGALGEPGRL